MVLRWDTAELSWSRSQCGLTSVHLFSCGGQHRTREFSGDGSGTHVVTAAPTIVGTWRLYLLSQGCRHTLALICSRHTSSVVETGQEQLCPGIDVGPSEVKTQPML